MGPDDWTRPAACIIGLLSWKFSSTNTSHRACYRAPTPTEPSRGISIDAWQASMAGFLQAREDDRILGEASESAWHVTNGADESCACAPGRRL